MKILKRLKRRIAMWFFVRRIGKLSKEYEKLSQQTERTAFLMQCFGHEWPPLSVQYLITESHIENHNGVDVRVIDEATAISASTVEKTLRKDQR